MRSDERSGATHLHGELHPRWQAKYELPQPAVLFELDAGLLQQVPVPRPGQPSRFPPVLRDLAVLVELAAFS